MLRRIAMGGLVVVLAVVGGGCAPEPKHGGAPTASGAAGGSSHAHHDDHPGPHDGALAEWGGGKYFAEILFDHEKKETTVYILGSDEKSPAPIAAETILVSVREPRFQVELKAAPQEGDGEGKASRFIGEHEQIATVRDFAGTISGEVDGVPYAGDFVETDHDHDHPH